MTLGPRQIAIATKRSAGNRCRELLAQRLDCADRIVSRQMHTDHAPSMRFERLEISQILRLVELREIVRRAGNRDRFTMILRDLQEQSRVRTALVELTARMEALRPIRKCGRDTEALDH